MERQPSRTFSDLPRAARSLGTAVWRAFAATAATLIACAL